MKKIFIIPLAGVMLLAGLVGCHEKVSESAFDRYFEPKSLRVDFALEGNSDHQTAEITRLSEEPVWGGPRRNLIEPFEYGGYIVRLYSAEGEVIYTRTFNTLFDEWRTTEEARTETQRWDNSMTVPMPRVPVTLELAERHKSDMEYHTLLRTAIDPAETTIQRRDLPENRVLTIQDNGDPATKVDLVFLAEGYTAGEQDKFRADAERFTEALFATPPFGDHRGDFNVWAVALESADTGTTNPGANDYRNTALHSTFYTFGIDRYLTTSDIGAIRDAVWNVPCDAAFVLVNEPTYAGGGIYNFYAIGTSDNPMTLRVFTHELGHSLGGLADEYYTSEVAYLDYYNQAFEPAEPNITTLIDFGRKWEDMLAEGTPVPTPATKDNLATVGVYEGGGYVEKGVYRPMVNCMMRNNVDFCPVCQRALVRMIDYLCDK
ncbi:IgA Peptidase M64 [Alistipes sp. OttesenSCG-928-B03]|nr:IgA Peptidase M64 [Alistipes sp. OttesenSCG-928-B03]